MFSREAFEARGRGDIQRATEAKNKELLNHFLFREASKEQEFVGKFYKPFERTEWWPGSLMATALVVGAWGYFIWSGSVATIWPMFGTANQLLAAVALMVATTALINAGRVRYIWVTVPPMA